MDHARSEPQQLAARVRAREVAGEVDDERSGQRLPASEPISILLRVDCRFNRPAARQARRILDAAVRVFARRGYHGARVGDIATEAGVAHGLLYHYFSSKDEVLETVFRENFGELLERFRAVEAADETAAEKLAGIAKILLRTWRNDPDLVTVMVRDVARSAQLQYQVVEVGEAFAIVQRVVEQGQAEGDFRPDLDARLASWIVYGGLEEVLTGWVLGQLPDGDEEVARAERTAIELALGGLTARSSLGGMPKIFNLYADPEWDREEERPGWRSKDAWVGHHLGAEILGGSMYEVEPGNRLWPYHTHHANEEWLLVVRGRPTLRTPEGEQELAEGDVVAFPRGDDGLHQVSNGTDAPIRVLMLLDDPARPRPLPGQRQVRRAGRQGRARAPLQARPDPRLLGRRGLSRRKTGIR